MKKIQDKFSIQAKTYKKYRPTYPQELYDEILKVTPNRDVCWDCGTGNGQVAVELSKYFRKVYATDISENQMKQAEKKSNIIYQLQRAEDTHFEDNLFDLITVGQAVHWFDLDKFNEEVKRVAKPQATVSFWTYGLLSIEENIDQLLNSSFVFNEPGFELVTS